MEQKDDNVNDPTTTTTVKTEGQEDREQTYRSDFALDALPEGGDVVGVGFVGGVPHADHRVPHPHRNTACW